MRIAIDITPITSAKGNFGDKSGVYRYTLNLIVHLAKVISSKRDKLYLLDIFGYGTWNLPIEVLNIIKKNNVDLEVFGRPTFFKFEESSVDEIPVVRYFAKKIDRWVLDPIYKRVGLMIHLNKMRNFLSKEKIDLIHFSDTVFFDCHCKKVITIHDLVPFKFPELQRPETIQIHKRRARFIRKKIDGIISVSKNTERDVRVLFPGLKEKTMVIYEGVDSSLKKISKLEFIKRFKKARSKVLEKIIWRDYYLSLGTLEPRKNYGVLLKGYTDLFYSGQTERKLIIIGGKGWGGIKAKIEEFIKENYLTKQILLLGFVSDEILSTLLSGAYAFIYPSFYEGFGLPPLEAMSFGVPVVVSCASSLPEVVGTEALMFEPLNVEKLKRHLMSLNDSLFWKRYSEYCVKRAKRFRWEKTARETLDFYKNVISEHDG